MGTAYALVIHAMRTLPAAEVVTYSNAGIVLATVLSMVVFQERVQWQQRAVAAGVTCAGLACIGVGRALQGRGLSLTAHLRAGFRFLALVGRPAGQPCASRAAPRRSAA
jgi:hypothetical protein